MLLNPFLKKLSYIKPVKKQQKTIEGILSHVLNVMVTKVTQIVPSNLFVPAREISDLLPIFLNIDFPQLLDIQEKMLKFHINVQKDLTKLMNGLLDLPFCWVTITSIFRSANIGFFPWM